MEWYELGMRAMHCFKIKRQYGYTLIEAMIAIVISSIIISTIYQIFYSQQKNYMTHNESYNMNQNLRSAIYILTKEVRSSGYDPTEIEKDKKKNMIGFVKNFDSNIFSDMGLSDINYLTDRNRIAFGVDKNSDKCISTDNGEADPTKCETKTQDLNALKEDGERGEQIAYRLYENNLQRFNSEIYSKTNNLEAAWQIIATNIDAFNFVFLDKNNTPISDPVDNRNVRSIEISILARTEKKDHEYKNNTTYRNKQGDDLCPTCKYDHYHRQHISTTIRLRNIFAYNS
jgi:prepilin-type N-terminal cleavage/methylation domain-containing protein